MIGQQETSTRRACTSSNTLALIRISPALVLHKSKPHMLGFQVRIFTPFTPEAICALSRLEVPL